jgi:putative transposase
VNSSRLKPLETVDNTLEQAIKKRGIPERIYCDNGKVFLSEQVKRIGAEIGTRVIHTKVRDAAAKGKIERWFQTVRSQFLENHETIDRLNKLNAAFFKWVEEYNQNHHTGIHCTPMEKWLKSPRSPNILTETFNTDDIFWLEATRMVKKDGTFSLNSIRYETNYTLAGQKVTIRYNSLKPTTIRVYHDGSFIGCSHRGLPPMHTRNHQYNNNQ